MHHLEASLRISTGPVICIIRMHQGGRTAEPVLYQSNMLEIMHQAGILIISRVVELRWGEWKNTSTPKNLLPIYHIVDSLKNLFPIYPIYHIV